MQKNYSTTPQTRRDIVLGLAFGEVLRLDRDACDSPVYFLVESVDKSEGYVKGSYFLRVEAQHRVSIEKFADELADVTKWVRDKEHD